MATTKISPQNTGIIFVATYLVLFAISAIIIYLANLFFPHVVVLGTMTIPLYWAVFHAAEVLALFGTLAIPLVHEYENWRGKMLTSLEWMVSYFILNFVGVWLIARFPEQFGLGITSWVVALALAVVLDLFQGIAMMQLQKFQK